MYACSVYRTCGRRCRRRLTMACVMRNSRTTIYLGTGGDYTFFEIAAAAAAVEPPAAGHVIFIFRGRFCKRKTHGRQSPTPANVVRVVQVERQTHVIENV